MVVSKGVFESLWTQGMPAFVHQIQLPLAHIKKVSRPCHYASCYFKILYTYMFMNLIKKGYLTYTVCTIYRYMQTPQFKKNVISF